MLSVRSIMWFVGAWVSLACLGLAQQRAWRTAEEDQTADPQEPYVRRAAYQGAEEAPGVRTIASGPSTSLALPRDAGQTWKEYDLRAYTQRITNTKRPERTVVDWILRETGYEAWHGEPMGILSAGANSIKVYHTPEMHQTVADVVSRFTSPMAESQSFGMRVVTISDPNWRSRAYRVMRPVPVQTPGVQAWMVKREDAALLLAEFSKRSDYREHSSPQLLIGNGETHVLSRTRPRSYIRDIKMVPNVWPGFEAQADQIEEGFAVEFSPLLTQDGQMIDAIFKCHIDHVEQMAPVLIDVPTQLAPRQRTKIEVPQVSQFRLQERFRWPVDEVLLIGLGVVPAPFTVDGNPLNPLIKQLPFTQNGPERSDMLIVVESKIRRADAPVSNAARTTATRPSNYHGRY